MELAAVDIERFNIGLFGDLRLQKRGLGATELWLLPRVHAYSR